MRKSGCFVSETSSTGNGPGSDARSGSDTNVLGTTGEDPEVSTQK